MQYSDWLIIKLIISPKPISEKENKVQVAFFSFQIKVVIVQCQIVTDYLPHEILSNIIITNYINEFNKV